MRKKASATFIIFFILLILALFVYLRVSDPFKIFESLKSIVEENENEDNDFFTAEYAGILNNGDAVSSSNLPTGCSSFTNNVLGCIKNTKLKPYVGIKNIGMKDRSFVPRLKIGYECKADKCKDVEIYESQGECLVNQGKTIDCALDKEVTFDKAGRYKIFAGALCRPDVCEYNVGTVEGEIFRIYDNKYMIVEIS